MCGIAAIWGKQDEALIRKMMSRQAHRGPDDEGVYHAPAGTMGHRRLAIMDPENGRQPLLSEDGARALVANGEFYNFPALFEDLRRRHRFRTRSDSESALHLYEETGIVAPRHLDGMFSLALADGPRLLVARDCVGIKPLYHGKRAGARVFASELKALAGLAEEVREFPPGYVYDSEVGFRPYRTIPYRKPCERALEVQQELVRRTLEGAVEKRLMSDVPVGVFLSGGLDSSLIAAIARRRLGRVDSFAVGTEGSLDLEAARRVARHLGTVHHEYVLTPGEVRAKLSKIIHHLESFDQDLVRNAIPCYFTSRLAAGHVKVVLTGEGADELFAGYAYYRGIDDADALHRELYRSVRSLHHTNLQRVDRLTMAHSIEGRVPFLDLEMVELALTIPPHLKLRRRTGDPPVEKWLLRKACEDLLPPEIVWRRKEQFDEGSGTVGLLDAALEGWLDAEDARRYAARHPRTRLRSVEECLYHKLLTESYETPRPILGNVARWADRPVARPGDLPPPS